MGLRFTIATEREVSKKICDGFKRKDPKKKDGLIIIQYYDKNQHLLLKSRESFGFIFVCLQKYLYDVLWMYLYKEIDFQYLV